MDLTTIKKNLYKEKPTAIRTAFKSDEYVHYVSQLSGNQIIQFHIPISEATFENEVPAQLLIRWIHLK